MAKDPAFLFYPSDFLTGTMFMNNEQIGIYIRLLCSQHQHGGIIDKVSFNSLVGDSQILKSKFIETETGFYNERLTEEMQKRNKKSNNMSETAKEVWAKRKAEKLQLVSKSNTIVNEINTNVQNNDTIVIQPVNVNKDEYTFNFKNSMLEYGFKENLVSEWLKVRKNKKATNTETAYKKFIIQVELTKKDKNEILEKCIEKSWSGFSAEWILKETNFNKDLKQETPTKLTYSINKNG